jgi:hypothetical protein
VRIALLCLGVAVLCAVLYFMGVREIAALARRSGWSIVWMAGLYAVQLAIRGWVIWRSLPAPRLPLGETVRIRFAAEAVELLTFTGPFLAEPAKGYMFIRRGVPPAQAAGVIVFEFLTYTVVAAAMALVGLLVLLSRHAFTGGVHTAIVVLVWVLGAFTAGVVWAAITGTGLLAPAARLLRPLLGAERSADVVENVASMEGHLLDILHRNPSRFVEALAAETAAHTLLAVEIFILFSALGFHGLRADPIIVEGGVKFINAVFVFIPVGALGYPAALGVTLSLMRRVRGYLVAGLGLVLAPLH